jgi:hypothetical protein
MHTSGIFVLPLPKKTQRTQSKGRRGKTFSECGLRIQKKTNDMRVLPIAMCNKSTGIDMAVISLGSVILPSLPKSRLQTEACV